MRTNFVLKSIKDRSFRSSKNQFPGEACHQPWMHIYLRGWLWFYRPILGRQMKSQLNCKFRFFNLKTLPWHLIVRSKHTLAHENLISLSSWSTSWRRVKSTKFYFYFCSKDNTSNQAIHNIQIILGPGFQNTYIKWDIDMWFYLLKYLSLSLFLSTSSKHFVRINPRNAFI